MRKFFYCGDVNAEYGGYFYTTDNRQYGFSEVLRITPCSDAGGPDNLYWLESLTVNVPEDASKRAMLLQYIDMDEETFNATQPRAQFCVLVDAAIGYGLYDQEFSEVVQVGKSEFVAGRGFEMPHVDKQLRGNASIRAYALKLAKES